MLDLRVAFRILAKNPGATALSILSITLGIGLTAGMFSVVDAMFLRPLPISRPGEIYEVASRADDGQDLSYYGWPDYLDMAASGEGLVTLVAYQRRSSQLAGPDGDLSVLTHPVTSNYFQVLGVKAELGRASVDAVEGRPQVVVGHQLWERRFGGDPHLVGKTILLNGKAFLVAGIVPREFTGLNRGVTTDIWMSADAWFTVFGARRDQQSRRGQFQMFARLRPGVSAERAGAVLDAAIRGDGKHKPAPPGKPGTNLLAVYALSWTDNLEYGGGLLLILGAILFVACANVAQLRLGQAEARKREMGVRMAMGAGAWRVTSQLLLETGLISGVGAGLGVVLAQVLMKKAAEFVSAGQVYIDYNIRLDARVLVYTILAVMVSMVLTGVAPVRHALRLDVSESLKSGQGTTGERGGWQRRILIVGQVAVSVALFGCAVLFTTSLRNAAAVRPGMDPTKKMLVLTVGAGPGKTASTWCEPACTRLAALPGVRGATYARRLPLSGSGGGFTVRAEVSGMPPLDVYENNVGSAYFALMGTRLVAGRGIDAGDREDSQPVVVVSEAFANRLLPGRSPLGEWFKVDGVLRQVVGVAADGPSNSLHESPQPFLFLPYTQVPLGDLTIMVETAGEPAAMERAVRQELLQFDSRVTIYSAGTLRRRMEIALSWDRMMASIASGLGLFGILLTAAGLFGVLQYMVSRRTRELGLRMAIGAGAADIQRLILGQCLKMAAWGVPVGLALLGAAVYWVRSAVLGVSPLDWRIYCLSAAAVTLVTLASGWLPARRASRLDPMEALRPE
ncbi:MAG TPA: ADOP family duplicated permease [Bryobacteraceae bacterium]|nr:ADOP family duplicated permease [Bryobacteraceae bacterium]